MFWKQITQWVQSEEEESPFLITGSPEANWDDFLVELKHKSGLRAEDVVEMSRENHAIKTKETRALLDNILTTSFSGKRLIIIPEAERLRRESANALLKELEDSSGTNRFVLTTGYKGRLPETIVSRCQIMRLPAVFMIDPSKELVSTSEVLSRLGDLSRKQPLNLEEINEVSGALQLLVKQKQYSPDVQRALLRLRDFHKIRALGGSEKMASDVLVASLVQLSKTIG